MPASESLLIEVRTSKTAGRGAFALQAIPAGALISECHGEVLPAAQVLPEHYAMMVGEGLWLCSLGDYADDYLNHSCSPNVGFLTGAAAFYALCDIAAGEELTWDYSTSMTDPSWEMRCGCGAAACRGVIRAFDLLSAADQARLAPTALDYIRQRTNRH